MGASGMRGGYLADRADVRRWGRSRRSWLVLLGVWAFSRLLPPSVQHVQFGEGLRRPLRHTARQPPYGLVDAGQAAARRGVGRGVWHLIIVPGGRGRSDRGEAFRHAPESRVVVTHCCCVVVDPRWRTPVERASPCAAAQLVA